MGDKIEAAVTEATDKATDKEATPIAAEEGVEETSDSSEETSTPETDEAEELEVEETDELSEIIKGSKSKDKDNVQRRIDQLTAQLKELKDENSKLKTKESPSKEPEYTEGQLKSALKKAIEEGDSELVWDILDYKTKTLEKSLVNRYEAEKKQTEEQARAINNDWQKVTMDYSKVWEDDKGRELYSGAKRDLDIRSEGSLLYKLAAQLYQSVDEDGSRKYADKGGQRAAVADALNAILRRKKISPVDSEKKRMERQLGKEKRKKALAGAGSTERESVGKATSEADKLAEYLAERQDFRNKRINR